MLSPQRESELRKDFVQAGERVEVPSGLSGRLLNSEYSFGPPRHLARALVLATAVVLALAGAAIGLTLAGRQPVAASGLASEFQVFNRPATQSDSPDRNVSYIRLTERLGQPTAVRLLAQNPGNGISTVYAVTYPHQICLVEQDSSGGSAGCNSVEGLEGKHVMFEVIYPSSPPGSLRVPVALGLVANDVMNVTINGSATPVANNFFMATLANQSPLEPLTLTVQLSDGAPITTTLSGN
jgi:hypothetical protein